MLELLSCFVLIRVTYCFSVYLTDIREPVDYKSPEQDCIRNLVILNAQTVQCLQRFQLRDLNKAVYVVVLEQKSL